MSNVRVPTTFQLTSNAPIRGSVAAPPYTLVNLSTDQTAWISSNPGMAVGQGTPLYPGTSIKWTQTGDLWLIGTGTMQVVVSYDVEDWQPNPAAIAAAVLNSGVIVVDNPQVIFSGTGTSSGDLDVSRYQSIYVNMAGPAVPYAALQVANIIWMDSAGNTTGIQRIEFTPQPNGAMAWQAMVPCLGAKVRIQKTFSASLIIVSSNRPQDSINQLTYQAQGGSGFDNFLLNVRGTVAGGGTGAFHVLPPWFGTIQVLASLHTGAPANSLLSIEHWNKATVNNWIGVIHLPLVAGLFASFANFNVAAAGSAIRLQMFNNTAGILTYDMTAIPVTGGTWD